MKHKGMFRLLSCLLAVVLCATAFSVTAFASGGDEYTEPPSEAQTEPTDEPTADIEFQIPEEYLAYLENIDLDALMDTLLSLLGGMGDVSEEETESGQIGTVTTNGSRLNVRIGAGLENRAVTQLDNGTTVDVLGTEGDWVMVLLPERVGYVHSDYLTIADKPADGGDGETPSISLDPDMLNELLSMFGGMFVGTEDTGGEALTPDGNMSLIDDIGSPEKSGKQFITVQTKNGNVFYLIIDRDDEGESTIHFLNQVDEADLMALMEDGEAENTPIVCSCTDKCAAGAVKTDCAVCMANMSECVGKAPEPVEPDEPEEPAEEKGGNGALIAVVLLILAGGGGAAVYFLVLKPKQGKTKKVPSDIDDFDLEDEEYLIEDDTETDTDEETEDIE